MQASTPPPLATSATCATAGRAAVGSGIGAVRRPRPAWAVCGDCRLKAAFPDRVRKPRPAWLSAHGRQALGPAWPQPAAPARQRPAAQAVGSKLARLDLDFGRARWLRGNAERMNGKDLSERNTFFICDTVNADQALRKNVRPLSPSRGPDRRPPGQRAWRMMVRPPRRGGSIFGAAPPGQRISTA